MPVKISRTKVAPVAAARAMVELGSQSTLTPKGTVDLVADAADDVGHGRGRGHVDLELVGPVVLVAEHHRVDACRLQRADVRPRVLDEPIDAALLRRAAAHRA